MQAMALFVADPYVAADGPHVNESVLDRDLNADVGVGLQERRQAGWQHGPRGAR